MPIASRTGLQVKTALDLWRNEEKMKSLDIDQLSQGLPTITPIFCRMLVESAVFCLEYNRHVSKNCILDGHDGLNEKFDLAWNSPDSRVLNTYGDLQEVTEYGATGIAILLTVTNTKYSTVSRAFKAHGFDYWVGDKDADTGVFQEKARLEISGILSGSEATFRQRIKQKTSQTDKSDSMGTDCYISVVEFGDPKASLLQKHKKAVGHGK